MNAKRAEDAADIARSAEQNAHRAAGQAERIAQQVTRLIKLDARMIHRKTKSDWADATLTVLTVTILNLLIELLCPAISPDEVGWNLDL